ncbi:MAG: GTP-dependent dephospho-CoA kinase [Thermoplasmata archaeon]|nr:GTP-dependent dephospho-CoA kinase [Thermoplasmata archaeon]
MAADARPRVAYLLPDALRRELAAPFGPVLSTDQLGALLTDEDVLVAVGDVVSLTVKELGLTPRLFVCDFQTQRGQAERLFEVELGSWGRLAFKVRNPAGQVTREAWDAIRLGMGHEDDAPGEGPVRVFVEGEEDLLGLPCFLEAPMGAKVLYGMPGQGVAVVEVDAPLQDRVRALLGRFTQT